MAEDFDWVAEARRIADAEVERAVKEFESGEDVMYPSYATICYGKDKPPRELNGEMRVLYPAGRPVVGTLTVKTVDEPHGRTRYFTNALVPREEIVLDVPKLQEQARYAAEGLAKSLMKDYGLAIDPKRFLKVVHIALWNWKLRGEFSRQFSEAAKAYPGKLETFVRHQHLVKCSDGKYRPLVM